MQQREMVWTYSMDMRPKLGNKSDEAMKGCDEALNASLLQFLCRR
jgi:hypothetical protein